MRKAVFAGWNDGCIRAFTPQTGQLQWTIHNGHNKGVSALDVTSCGRRIVSGGGEGQVNNNTIPFNFRLRITLERSITVNAKTID